jgi:23S rRNA (cytidine1920-2'-O)/16S rRNA (cytidine1409-2'-O)-methyltransferase
VTVLERTNLRHLQPHDLPSRVDLVTLDLSFISVLKVMPAVAAVMRPHAEVVVLIKPQFEAGPAHVARGGIVRDAAVHDAVVAAVTAGMAEFELQRVGLVESPIRGANAGNKEFLAHFVRRGPGDALAPLLAQTPRTCPDPRPEEQLV